MTHESVLNHEFVEFIPDELKQGTIYISIRFATATHLCICGCGNKVVTPIRPTDWKVIFDGKTVSLDPSIGNWSFPCQSHYWIRNNRVKWARKWSQAEIETGRNLDRRAKKEYFAKTDALGETTVKKDLDSGTTTQTDRGFWQTFKIWWSKRSEEKAR